VHGIQAVPTSEAPARDVIEVESGPEPVTPVADKSPPRPFPNRWRRN
jgi:hypothetical protein